MNGFECKQYTVGAKSVQTGNESEERVHLRIRENDGRIKSATKKKKKKKIQVSAIMKLTWNGRKGNPKIF